MYNLSELINNINTVIYIIYGPTGSGKTKLAIEMIKKSSKDAEVISADSRQIYRYMDIGTNKDKYLYKELNIPIHLIDIINPDQRYSVYEWYKETKKLIKEIEEKNKDIYIVGGTGLYLDSILFEKKYLKGDITKINGDIPLDNILNEIKRLDKNIFLNLTKSERSNRRRMEILLSNLLSSNLEYFITEPLNPKDYKLKNPKIQRDKLYSNINNRVDEMFKRGLVEETKNLINLGYGKTDIIKGAGYKEVVKFINNEIEIEVCKDKVKQAYRNYAKRQITWFKKYTTMGLG